jgi:asparagine synthetase B (glutamine-hydrolysing)
MKTKKPDVRAVLLAELGKIESDSVGVLLSGGIDSASIMFALLELGKKVTAYSFTIDGHVSTDFSLARRNATAFGVPFVPVFLPRDLGALKRDLHALALTRLATKKTDYECGWPMIHAYGAVKEPVVASGMGADGHFCISKKGMIHYRDRIDEFRLGLYSSPGYAQRPLHDFLARSFGKQACMPYLSDAMRAAFLGTTWEQVNKPKQKQPILDAFSQQFARMKVLPHVNLQLGDSRIAEHMAGLLKSDWNKRDARSMVAIYNDLSAGRLSISE